MGSYLYTPGARALAALSGEPVRPPPDAVRGPVEAPVPARVRRGPRVPRASAGDVARALPAPAREAARPAAAQLASAHAVGVGSADSGALTRTRLHAPSAEFLWLKPIDRRLWYMLNCIGRQTPYPEVGGPFAHWRAEQVMGRPSLTPMIDEAIKALEGAIREVKLTPKELQELKP